MDFFLFALIIRNMAGKFYTKVQNRKYKVLRIIFSNMTFDF